MGVERFYLYDNESDDASLDVLAPYQPSGTVVVNSWSQHPGQMAAYSHCVGAYADDARWIAFIDIDQFFFSPDGRDLREVLAGFDRPEIGGVVVNYADFGTSGHVTNPGRPVIESYLHRMADDERIQLAHLIREPSLDPSDPASYFPMNAHVSSVVRPRRVVTYPSPHFAEYVSGTHAVTENGDPASGPLTDSISRRQLRMNHYWTKSVEECQQKFLRGRSDTGATREWPGEFLLRERAMRELDVEILRYAEPLRKALGVGGPPVEALVEEAVERMSMWSARLDALDAEVLNVATASSLTTIDKTVDRADVVVRGRSLDWADGSESQVLSTLRGARDRSSASDELASAISDWPTRYHFSRLRSKILGPLDVGPATRILDLGGGTGPLSRKLAEQGATVVLLEGSIPRARAAAVRCEGMSNVSVEVGRLFDLDEMTEPFDVVLAVGLLEYAQSSPGGIDALLEKAVTHLGPEGAIVIAIENSIGLKYLLGYAEDHVGLPWVGLEGYIGIDNVRTYTRQELSSILTGAGLPAQAWYYPFPDYKLPTVIVSDRGYDVAKPDVVDSIVRHPCSNDASLPVVVCDARAAHRTMLRAGLGREVANSFLVVAARTNSALEVRVDRETLAWLPGTERRSRFMRDRRLVSSGPALAIVDDSASSGPVEDGWLIQRRHPTVPYATGDPLDVVLADALARADVDRVRELLTLWANTLRDAAVVPSLELDGTESAVNPFSTEHGQLALPGDYIDSLPSNFVYRDRRLERIDAEWEARGLVDFDLVCARALFHFVVDALTRGIPLLHTSDRGIREQVAALAAASGTAGCERALSRLPAAEAALDAIVTQGSQADVAAYLNWLLDSPGEALTAYVQAVPVTALRRHVEALSNENRRLQLQLDAAGKSRAWKLSRIVVSPIATPLRLARRIRAQPGPSSEGSPE